MKYKLLTIPKYEDIFSNSMFFNSVVLGGKYNVSADRWAVTACLLKSYVLTN
jgi:hypothetical protein